MLVRHVVVPASPEELWDALTEPDSLEAWFGARVDWDLRPGGSARFVGDDGTVRGGVVEAVRRARYLRFRWWPEADPDGPPGPSVGAEPESGSQVTYDLEADGEGTRLTVTEQLVPTPTAGPGDSQAGVRASAASAAVTAIPCGADPGSNLDSIEAGGWSDCAASGWSDWDGRLFQCWACVAASVPVGRRGR
ncbi:MAG: SRPBCC family protein [Acidimicrobiales bacterium]